MSPTQVVRAWRDPEYRSTLSPEQLAALPSHPAGLIELSDDQLASASGVNKVITVLPPCTVWTFHNNIRCCPL